MLLLAYLHRLKIVSYLGNKEIKFIHLFMSLYLKIVILFLFLCFTLYLLILYHP